MNRRYIIPTIILLILGVWFIFMPEVDNSKRELSPNQLLAAMNESSRFVSTDIVSDLIIKNDPGFLLIDVRSEEEYSSYNLPGSINIPLDSLLLPKWVGYLNQYSINNIFYSNDELKAETAWIVCARKGYKNNYVLSKGLNNWFETIIEPVVPSETASQDEWDLYQTRLAASQFFTGAKEEAVKPVVKRKVFVNKPNKQRAEGGC